MKSTSKVCNDFRITSCLNGIKTVGHRFAIIANHFYPLSKALAFLEFTLEQSDLDLDAWEKAVGRIVCSVARLEGELLLKYETHNELSRSMYFKVDKHLESRFERVKALHTLECGVSNNSNELFAQFKELIDLRNLVAHNPVYYESAEKGFCVTNGQSKSKYIALSQISELAEKAFTTGLQLTLLLRVWATNKS
ncbi:hypothetical protein FQP88_12395 [Vibrio atlanticus]|nr:hypothetical protein FQP88_12395 [Vibrio atlanticus]